MNRKYNHDVLKFKLVYRLIRTSPNFSKILYFQHKYIIKSTLIKMFDIHRRYHSYNQIKIRTIKT